jgi:hypothetical protein
MFRHLDDRLGAKAKGSRCSDRWPSNVTMTDCIRIGRKSIYRTVVMLPMFPNLDREVDDALSVPVAAMRLTVAERVEHTCHL